MREVGHQEIERKVRSFFAKSSVRLASLNIRQFPGEVIVVVEVWEDDFAAALDVASRLDGEIEAGFVSVKKASGQPKPDVQTRPDSLMDARFDNLIEVLNARSRTSEHQPSLNYVPDTAQNLVLAKSKRHHLVFGRRGAGKTALLLEAKKDVEAQNAVVFWINMHLMRNFTAVQAFLSLVNRLCDLPESIHAARGVKAPSVVDALRIKQAVALQLSKDIPSKSVYLLIPEIQLMLNKLVTERQGDLFIFLDDFHYLSVDEQPSFLDLVHSITRDLPVWIKAACIKHQSRWFIDNPPTGLQVGHDAAIIDLDITLEDPAKARRFLTSVLQGFIYEAKLSTLSSAISSAAQDRLVLASGGVPRDFLVLSSLAIETARQRINAKSTGVQDVNEAAGKFSQPKLRELEDDAASARGHAHVRQEVLGKVRKFLLDDKAITFFRVDFLMKEEFSDEYTVLQSLMDLRLLHLINASLSDETHAGRRSEVYMLDLSQFSGSRLRKNLRVLDLIKDYLVLKSTGISEPAKVGDTPRKLVTLLRRGPEFDLRHLSSLVGRSERAA